MLPCYCFNSRDRYNPLLAFCALSTLTLRRNSVLWTISRLSAAFSQAWYGHPYETASQSLLLSFRSSIWVKSGSRRAQTWSRPLSGKHIIRSLSSTRYRLHPWIHEIAHDMALPKDSANHAFLQLQSQKFRRCCWRRTPSPPFAKSARKL